VKLEGPFTSSPIDAELAVNTSTPTDGNRENLQMRKRK
jgi:hypothetical protein